MFAQVIRVDPGANILVPALPDYSAVLSPIAFGANLTILRGMALGKKTTDKKAYLFNKEASDGTQNFIGFNQISGATDANGMFYPVVGGTAALDYFNTGLEYGNMYTSGVFDPNKLYTAPTGTAVAEIDTITPTSPTTGDIYSVFNAAGLGVEVTVGATQTAAATVTLLKNAWNADPALTAIATPSGTATFILTAVTPGVPLGLTASTVGTGTAALVISTAGVAAQQKEVDTITPTGSPTTGDVYTLTITYANLTTHSVSATVGATQTVGAISLLLVAAWNADPIAAAYAVATGTVTVVLTAVTPGQTLSVAGSVVGTGTVSATVVTTVAYGRSLADIQISRPSAYILEPYGYWRLP